jgi:dTDP-4-dehydrorhamnose reductase
VILLTGASGFIGSRILAHLAARPPAQSGDLIALARREVPGVPTVRADLRDPSALTRALDEVRPSVIIHAGAMRDPASCERAKDEAIAVNFHATRTIATWSEAHAARLIFLSTDLVFDGIPRSHHAAPIEPTLLSESSPRRPINHYGVTKALAEDVVLATPRATVARIALTLGHSRPGEPARSPHEHVVHALRAGKPATLFENEYRTPIYVEDAATALIALIDHEVPCVHVAGPDRVSRMDIGLALARAHHLDERLCLPARHDASASGVERPLDTSMNTNLLVRLLASSGVRPPRGIADTARELAATEPNR